MICIDSHSDNPYFNLATEEFLLKKFSKDVFLLYVNEPSIVVGKHQNALAEINLDFVEQNNIKVARRLSGGGTVFHDHGNLNFCFIQTVKDRNLVNYSKFLKPVLQVLNEMGINAVAGDKNDILIDGLKISGNAEHVFKNRVLHHGTLLFDSDLTILAEALKVNLHRFNDRSVQSRRSSVANISGFLPVPMIMTEFRRKVFEGILKNSVQASDYEFSITDEIKINQLVKEKFATWEWNFGYSPDYFFSNSIEIGNQKIDVRLKVVKGHIQDIEFRSNGIPTNEFDAIANLLMGKKHFKKEIQTVLLIENSAFNDVSISKILKLLL